MKRRLLVGTRGSDLAIWQARTVAARLAAGGSEVEIRVVRSEGDRRPDLRLDRAPATGVFTAELEAALSRRHVDLAVHSLKDLPTRLAAGLRLGAVLPRASVGDVLLVRPEAVADGGALPLAPGALVGTAAPRRVALLRHAIPSARVPDTFRGNVPTRLAKCREGVVDAVILARAGLARLRSDPGGLVPHDLDPEQWLPAPAQAAVAVEIRADDGEVASVVAPLECAVTRACVEVERQLLSLLEAGCHAAVGARARPAADGGLELFAGALGADSAWRCVRVEAPADGAADAARSALAAAPPAGPFDACWRRAEAWW